MWLFLWEITSGLKRCRILLGFLTALRNGKVKENSIEHD